MRSATDGGCYRELSRFVETPHKSPHSLMDGPPRVNPRRGSAGDVDASRSTRKKNSQGGTHGGAEGCGAWLGQERRLLAAPWRKHGALQGMGAPDTKERWSCFSGVFRAFGPPSFRYDQYHRVPHLLDKLHFACGLPGPTFIPRPYGRVCQQRD